MTKLFGTDGVRGIVPAELSCELAFSIGKAAATVLSRSSASPLFLLAKDSRASGDSLEEALQQGIQSVGGRALSLGILPTPAVAYLVKKHRADAGIMISASHNPAEYNGIKIFDSNGFKLSDDIENDIEFLMQQPQQMKTATDTSLGAVFPSIDGFSEYLSFLESTISQTLNGMKIALDCANGATSRLAETLFSRLGATVFPIGNQPNGTNINRDCGSTHPETICRHTVEHRADLGITFDGDGDRVLFCDHQGNLIDGDRILSVLGTSMKEKGRLQKDTIVCTVMSNLGLFLFCQEQNIHTATTKVGDRYVLEEMIKNGYNLGGEQSGHIILSDYSTTGDGLLTALQVLAVLQEKKLPLSQVASAMKTLPQVLVNVRVTNEAKDSVLQNNRLTQLVTKITEKLGKKGRVLIRPSGTEPLIRVMIEGENQQEIQQDATAIATLIKTLSE